jgi:hypothetical protein
VGERLGFDNPWVHLLALPVMLLLGALAQTSLFLRMLLTPVQIQFHELGHASSAWLSGRAALPLPFGFTFWREEQSVFTSCCMAFLLFVLLHRALREQRLFGVVLASVLLLVFLWLTLLVSPEHSRMAMIAGGCAGELVLPALTIIAFYFPLPDRLRWDFFRYLVLGPAVSTWLSSAVMWLRIVHGKQSLPLGSILGTPGDGSGDLERLMAEYLFTDAELAALYSRIAWLTGVAIFSVYLVFALRAARVLWPEARWPWSRVRPAYHARSRHAERASTRPPSIRP